MNTDDMWQAYNGIQEHTTPEITIRLTPSTDCNFSITQPSDEIDRVLKHYLDIMEVGGLWKSCYCEATIIMEGKHLLLSSFEEELTFGQSGIQDGETIHLLFDCVPNLMRIHIYIHNLINGHVGQTFPMDTSALLPISYLKILHFKNASPYLNDLFGISTDEMVLKNGDTELLEGSKTLADYNIQRNTILDLDMPSYDMSYIVPTLTGMERIFFEPHTTLGMFRQKMKTLLGCKGPFRGAVRNAEGKVSYVYMDVKDMKFYIINFNPRAGGVRTYRYGALKNHYAIKELYEMVRESREYKYQKGYCFSRKSCATALPVGDFVFDGAWIKAFAPYIEAESNSIDEDEAMRLFYFPEVSKIFHLGRFHSRDTLQRLRVAICEREGLDPANKVLLCGTISEKSDEQCATLLRYHSWFKTIPLVILKRSENKFNPIHPITVLVLWQARSQHGPVKLTISADTTVSELKDQIEVTIQVPSFLQKLMYCGKLLENRCTLKEVGIANGSVVCLLQPCVRAPGRSSSQYRPWILDEKKITYVV